MTAYPEPGLYRRSFDVDMDPLVEVVQDTVGRHDSFALACTAKYYEDLGYPGHVNCSTNFNGQVTPYGVAPRKGWEALNFFYNTDFDTTNTFIVDEPWSRPGDYVLLRAADRPAVRLLGLPRRHRPGQWLGDHRHPCPRLPAREPVLAGDRPPRHPGGPPRHDP